MEGIRIRVYLRSSAASRFFFVDRANGYGNSTRREGETPGGLAEKPWSGMKNARRECRAGRSKGTRNRP
jgi:hypothetical protein